MNLEGGAWKKTRKFDLRVCHAGYTFPTSKTNRLNKQDDDCFRLILNVGLNHFVGCFNQFVFCKAMYNRKRKRVLGHSHNQKSDESDIFTEEAGSVTNLAEVI